MSYVFFRRLVSLLFLAVVLVSVFAPAVAAALPWIIPGSFVALFATNTVRQHPGGRRLAEKNARVLDAERDRCPMCDSLPPQGMVYCSDDCRGASEMPRAGIGVSGSSGSEDRNHGLSDQELADYRQRQEAPAELVADSAVEGYVPSGQGELLNRLAAHLKDQVAAAVLEDRETNSARSGHWEMHPQWVPDLRLTGWNGEKPLFGYPVKTDSACGLPSLVLGLAVPNPERGTPAAQVAAVAAELGVSQAWRLNPDTRQMEQYSFFRELKREREVLPRKGHVCEGKYYALKAACPVHGSDPRLRGPRA